MSSIYLREIDKVKLIDKTKKILSVCFEPTNRCPGKCPYCLIENHKKDPPKKELLFYLNTLIKQGVMRIGFGGGEPLLRTDIYELGKFVKDQGVGSLLRTSGMFKIDYIKTLESFDWIDISFDSADREIFQNCRPGVSFEILKKNIQTISQTENRLRISILITDLNKYDVFNTIDWLHKNGVKYIRFQSLVKRGKAKKNWEKLISKEINLQKILQKSVQYALDKGMNSQELKTISEKTLCIIKTNGDIYLGNPNGSEMVGNLNNSESFKSITRNVHFAQEKNYSCQ